MIRRLRARAGHAVDWRMRALLGRLDALGTRLDVVVGQLDAVERRLEAAQARLEGIADDGFTIRGQLAHEISPVLRAIVSEESANRRRLDAARHGTAYALAYQEPDPLVSILIATHDRPQLLVERSVASALAQTHANVEVVVVGDAADAEVEAAVRGVGDPRVRWANTTHRVVDAHPDAHWLVASTLPRNLAYTLARGRWLLDLDDDDALRPDAVERLLALAREDRLEVAYGPVLARMPEGAETWGEFPPRPGRFHWQGALLHGELRFFERELVAAAFGMPGDLYRIERMLRAGVRVGFTPEVVCDFYPSTFWGRRRRSVEGGEDVADAVDVGEPHRLVERQGEQ